MRLTSGLTVRQHERKSIEFEIEFMVGEGFRDQVRFSALSAASGQYMVKGIAVDLSSGGMGLSLPQFVPRMCEGRVRLYSPRPSGTARDGTPIFDVAFEHAVKVRRVYMSSHQPTYAVGVSFIDPHPGLADEVKQVLALVDHSGDGSDE